MRLIRNTIARVLLVCGVVASAAALQSCNAVYDDDLAPCVSGVDMRFVFDYNMEFANAFPSQVDCLSVFVFDAAGQLVERRVETTDALRDEGYRMHFELPDAHYHVVVYGGLECEMASFLHTIGSESIATRDDLGVIIDPSHIGPVGERPSVPLHDLYHGAIGFEVETSDRYASITVPMMRDTNHFRILLQHLDNSPVDAADFNFEITDDNILFDHANNVLPSAEVSYSPWASGNVNAGIDPSTGTPVQVGFAEMSTSRLMDRSAYTWASAGGELQRGPRLRITTASEGRVVADLPLANYLLMLKSEVHATMPSQEFLDRVSRWNLIFFLDRNNAWVRMNIVVDDWTVRVNNIDLR